MEEHLVGWLTRLEFITSGEHERRVRDIGFGILASRVWPRAPFDVVAFGAGFVTGTFLVDDEYMERAAVPHRQIDYARTLMKLTQILRDPSRLPTGIPDDAIKYHRAMQDLARRWNRIAPAVQALRLKAGLEEYYMATGAEVIYCSQEVMPSLEEYISLRESSVLQRSGCLVITEMAESSPLPGHLYCDPRFQRVIRAASRVIAWTNDILSGPRELAWPNAMNLDHPTHHRTRSVPRRATRPPSRPVPPNGIAIHERQANPSNTRKLTPWVTSHQQLFLSPNAVANVVATSSNYRLMCGCWFHRPAGPRHQVREAEVTAVCRSASASASGISRSTGRSRLANLRRSPPGRPAKYWAGSREVTSIEQRFADDRSRHTRIDKVRTSKVDIEEVQKLATEVRRAETSVAEGVKGFARAAAPTGTTFGNTGAAAGCMNAHNQTQSTMGALLKAFDATIDADAQRLTLALQVYRQTDAEAADQLLEVNRNRLDVISTQLTVDKKDGKDLTQAQAEQINKLNSVTGDYQNTVVAGDFNAKQVDQKEAFGSLGQQGYDTRAGVLYDGKGAHGRNGTSLSGFEIDHVMQRGVGNSGAERWATTEEESDHDGQIVDTTIANW